MGLDRTHSKVFRRAHPLLSSLIHSITANRRFQHKSHIGYGVAVTFTALMTVQAVIGIVRPGFDSPFPRVLFSFLVSRDGEARDYFWC